MTGGASETSESWEAAPLPAVTVIQVARWRVLVFLAGSSIMSLGGWMMPQSGQVPFMRWAGGGFFLACALVFAITLLPGAARIVFTPDVVSMRNLYRNHQFAWREMTPPVVRGVIPYLPPWLIGRALFAEINRAPPTATGKPSRRSRIAIPLTMYGSDQEIGRLAMAYWQQAHADPQPSSPLDPAASKD